MTDEDTKMLRHIFAGLAMQALIIAERGDLHHAHGAADAYRYADAMLQASKKEPDHAQD